MIVRCVNYGHEPLYASSGTAAPGRGGLDVGTDYLVLEINATATTPATFRIIDGEGTPAFWPTAMFDVVSSRFPSNWSVLTSRDGDLDIGPVAFRGLFWDEFFANRGDALVTFEREVEIIRAEA